jgi:RNA polymerase sigma factor (sigma-70 family)
VSECDADLVQRAQNGDREAFGELFVRHQPLMRRIAQRVLGSSQPVDDIAQEAALQAWLGLDSLRDPRQFGAWLAGIGLNVARRTRTRQSRAGWSLDALLGGRLVAEPVDDSASPAQLSEAADLSTTVRGAVADLPAGQRAAILLVYLSGLSYRETAAALGVEVGAVKTRLHKGRRHLQRLLQGLWTEDVMSQTSVKQQFVEVRVRDVRRREGEGGIPRSVVLLEEVTGGRQLPIWVGVWEGDSIAMLLEKVQVPRPLTHAFTANLLRAAGARVSEVRVHRLAEETLYAQVVLNGREGEKLVDARPSDVVALALELGAPMYVAAEVMDEVEAALPRDQAERLDHASAGIGAGQIVRELIERWPREPKPTLPA